MTPITTRTVKNTASRISPYEHRRRYHSAEPGFPGAGPSPLRYTLRNPAEE
jgi:hypothetical protein